jgi:hypothetical protein
MAKQFLILLPEGLENTKTNRKSWAEKVMNAAKSVGIWRFAPVFEYAGDESNSKEENVVDNLDMHLLNADIAGFLGRYVFDDINDIINDNDFKIKSMPRKAINNAVPTLYLYFGTAGCNARYIGKLT